MASLLGGSDERLAEHEHQLLHPLSTIPEVWYLGILHSGDDKIMSYFLLAVVGNEKDAGE